MLNNYRNSVLKYCFKHDFKTLVSLMIKYMDSHFAYTAVDNYMTQQQTPRINNPIK